MLDPRELTEEQEKAWKSLQRALKKCEKANILWYLNLEVLSPLNGNIVSSVEEYEFCGDPEKAFNLTKNSPNESVRLTCGFADDEHFAILK